MVYIEALILDLYYIMITIKSRNIELKLVYYMYLKLAKDLLMKI